MHHKPGFEQGQGGFGERPRTGLSASPGVLPTRTDIPEAQTWDAGKRTLAATFACPRVRLVVFGTSCCPLPSWRAGLFRTSALVNSLLGHNRLLKLSL